MTVMKRTHEPSPTTVLLWFVLHMSSQRIFCVCVTLDSSRKSATKKKTREARHAPESLKFEFAGLQSIRDEEIG